MPALLHSCPPVFPNPHVSLPPSHPHPYPPRPCTFLSPRLTFRRWSFSRWSASGSARLWWACLRASRFCSWIAGSLSCTAEGPRRWTPSVSFMSTMSKLVRSGETSRVKAMVRSVAIAWSLGTLIGWFKISVQWLCTRDAIFHHFITVMLLFSLPAVTAWK